MPVYYGGETGPDLEYCAELEHTTVEEIIRKHSGT
ncbi:MAG: carboxyltransferase domain-containing protein [Dorea longicatena]